jgi:hypothetical protein
MPLRNLHSCKRLPCRMHRAADRRGHGQGYRPVRKGDIKKRLRAQYTEAASSEDSFRSTHARPHQSTESAKAVGYRTEITVPAGNWTS